jgi:hypothetical protein
MHRLVKEPDGTTDLIHRRAQLADADTAGEIKERRGTSTPKRARKRFYTGALGGMKCRPFAFARNWWRRRRNTTRTHNEYAQKIFSDEGKHNGLYWKAANGEPQSPIGPLVAAAVAKGYAQSQEGAPPRIAVTSFTDLTAPGQEPGAKSYTRMGK